MRVPFSGKLMIASVVLSVAAAGLTWSPLAGQDNKKGADKAKTTEKAKPGDVEKPKGRLPPYYKDVVTEKQRDEIYTIQAKYEPQIDELQAQIDKLQEKRDAEIEKLLNASQKSKLEKLKAEKSKKKAAAAADDMKDEEPEKTEEPEKIKEPEKKPAKTEKKK